MLDVTHVAPRVHTLLLPLPATLQFGALVERSHGLIGRAGLNLHVVCAVVLAARAGCFGLVDVGPGLVTSENIVHLLAVKCFALHDCLHDRVDVRAGLAVELLLGSIRLDEQEIGASGAEVHGGGWMRV